MPQELAISHITRDFVANLAKQGKRVDDRPFDQYRAVRLKVGHIGKADGSCEVWLGNTRILAGVKLKPSTPYPDRPASGTMMTSVELNPMASPDFESGPPRPDNVELARVVDRGIRESGVIKFDELCITEGEDVWTVFIDIHVLDYDGNLFDAASLASLGAVMSATVPNVQYEKGKKDVPLPITEPPVSCTTAKIAGVLMSDPSLEEDQVMDARLTVALDKDGNIRAMQKGGNGSFTVQEIQTIIKTSQSNGARLRKVLEAAVKNGEASSE